MGCHDGFARIVLTANDTSGQVTVHARSPEVVTCAELFANDQSLAAAPHVGVALTEEGNVVGVLELVGGEPADLWMAPRDGWAEEAD